MKYAFRYLIDTTIKSRWQFCDEDTEAKDDRWKYEYCGHVHFSCHYVKTKIRIENTICDILRIVPTAEVRFFLLSEQ